MISNSKYIAMVDVLSSMARYPLVMTLGWQDIRQRYRRSALGAFWLTISMGIMIATIGLVFGQIFKSPMQEYLPFLAIGIVFWGFMSSVVNEGCVSFITAEAIIKQLNIPLFVHVLRCFWRNLIVLCHNIIIIPVIFIIFAKPFSASMLLAVPGMLLLSLNLLWIALVLGILSTRFRDVTQIIANVMQVVFYLTPIMWSPLLLPQKHAVYLLDLNPLYHLLEIIRAPLLGNLPTSQNWWVAIGMVVFGWMMTIAIYHRYRRRIPYWL